MDRRDRVERQVVGGGRGWRAEEEQEQEQEEKKNRGGRGLFWDYLKGHGSGEWDSFFGVLFTTLRGACTCVLSGSESQRE